MIAPGRVFFSNGMAEDRTPIEREFFMILGILEMATLNDINASRLNLIRSMHDLVTRAFDETRALTDEESSLFDALYNAHSLLRQKIIDLGGSNLLPSGPR